MTDKTNGSEAGQDGQPVERKELSPEEANAQFEESFKSAGRVQPLGTPEPGTPAAGTTEDEGVDKTTLESTAAPAVAAPAGDDPVKGLTKRMRKMEGTVGTINSRLSEISDSLKALAPAASNGTAAGTQEQVDAQLKNLKEIEEVIGEFKEFKPFMDELQSLRQDLAELPRGGATQEQVDVSAQTLARIREEVTEEVTLNVRHPNWREVTATPEFMGFMLAKGPSGEEYSEYCALRDNPKTAAQAQEMREDWKIDHPQWFETRGQYLFSTKAADSVHILDEFAELKKMQTQAGQHRQRQQNRLQRSVVPDGITETPAQGKTDEEAFQSGFKNARKQYLR